MPEFHGFGPDQVATPVVWPRNLLTCIQELLFIKAMHAMKKQYLYSTELTTTVSQKIGSTNLDINSGQNVLVKSREIACSRPSIYRRSSLLQHLENICNQLRNHANADSVQQM